MSQESRLKILAISSGGGHWCQLLRLCPAFLDADVTFATVHRQYSCDLPAGARFAVLTDATRWSRWRLLVMVLQVAWLVVRVRPDAIITTGAAPGFIAIRMGRLLGARTVWIDSIANVEQLSLSGKRIGGKVDLWLTQWPHLVRTEGPVYRGGVL